MMSMEMAEDSRAISLMPRLTGLARWKVLENDDLSEAFVDY